MAVARLSGRTQYGFDSYDRINEERLFAASGRCIRRMLFKYDASSRRLVDKFYTWNKNDPYGPLIESTPGPEDDATPRLPVREGDKELPGVGLPQFRGDSAAPAGTDAASPAAKPAKEGPVRLPQAQEVARTFPAPPVRPVTLLLTLLFAAAVAGSWAYASYARHLRAGAAGETNPGSADPATATPDEVALLRKNLAFFKDQFERLKRENESLSAAVKKLSDQVAARPAEAGAASANAAGTPAAAFSLDGLVREVEMVRELRFPTPPKFVRIPAAQLERKIRDALEREIPPGEAQLRERAARAIGLTEDPFKFLDAVTGLTLEQSGGVLRPGDRRDVHRRGGRLRGTSRLEGPAGQGNRPGPRARAAGTRAAGRFRQHQ